MQEKKTERAPGSYEDFVAYLGTVRTEEELFSPLTYWFVGQNCPEDVCFRPQLVEARAARRSRAASARTTPPTAKRPRPPGSGRAAAASRRPSSTSQSASTTSPSGT